MTDHTVLIKIEMKREAALNYLAELDRLCDPRLPFEVVSLAYRLTGRQNHATMEAFAEARRILFENAPPDSSFGVQVPDHWRIGADGSIDTGNEFVGVILDEERQKVSAADQAVTHLIIRMSIDPRLAYYIGPFTESYRLLTIAYAKFLGEDIEEFRKRFEVTLKTEAPICRECAKATE